MTNRVALSVVERFAFAGGYEFGTVGAYERLVGRAHFAVDPAGAAQRGITDLDKAPTDGDGLAHFTGDFLILKPADPARGNCRLFFDYGNRGNKRMLQFFNDAPASNDPRTLAQAGNGFLMRRGYTVAWLAWQGDLLPGNGRLLLDLPVARERHGPVTGLVRTEYIADRSGITVFPLSGRVSVRSHPTVSLDPREARLTRRRYPYDEREAVPPENWCFARVEGGTGLDNQGAVQAVVPSDSHIYIPGGFEPGWIYELVYTARDPLVLGLGHVVVRDFVSFLRYGKEDAAGRLNPLCERDRTIEKAYAWGRSQTGRYLRDFVYRGFNADTAGRKVFDGILPHVRGCRPDVAQPRDREGATGYRGGKRLHNPGAGGRRGWQRQSGGSERRWWLHRSAPIAAGICGRAALVTAPCTNSRPATSRSRRPLKNGAQPATRDDRFSSDTRMRRPMSGRSPRPRVGWSNKG